MPKPQPPGSRGLPLVGETLAFLKDGFRFIEERRARHGPVFRTSILGRDTAVIIGPAASERFVDQRLIARTGSQPGFLFELFAGPSLPHLDDAEHLRRKTLVNAAFDRAALASYLPGLERVIEAGLERWRARGALPWIPELKRVAIEGICGNFLGLSGEQLATVVADYDTVTKGIGGLPVALPGTAFRRGLRARDRLLALFDAAIGERRRQAATDGLSRMLGASLNGSGLSDDAARRELHHIVIAGYVVFAELAWLVIELARHPRVRERVAEEVCAVPGPLTLASLDGMTYLTQVVMEVKRLCPILPAIFGIARAPFELAGHTVPAGWMVLWALRSTHLDPQVYTDPLTFDPERFSAERAEHRRHEHAFVPQGAGSRTGHRCPGEDYATYFMKSFAAVLLRAGAAWQLEDTRAEYAWGLTPPEPRDGLKVRITAPR